MQNSLQLDMKQDEDCTICRYFDAVEDNQPMRLTLIFHKTEGLIYKSIYPKSVGRSNYEILRIIEAHGTGKLCPASWTEGNDFVNIKD